MAFSTKPAYADTASNANPSGTAPTQGYALDAAANGLTNIGSYGAGWDLVYGSIANPIDWQAGDGGFLQFDHNDEQRAQAAAPVAPLVLADGWRIHRITMPATLPAGSEVLTLAGSGTTSNTNGQYSLRAILGNIQLRCKPGTGSIVPLVIPHTATGIIGGSTFDVIFRWGTQGIALFVVGPNGTIVAAAANDPANTGSITILDTGAGEGIGYLAESGSSVYPVVGHHAYSGGDTSPTDAQVTALLADPFWPIRKNAPFVTAKVRGTITSLEAAKLNMVAAASEKVSVRAVNATTGAELCLAYGTVDGTQTAPASVEVTVDGLATGDSVDVAYEYMWPDDGARWYRVHADSVLTGKHGGGGNTVNIAFPNGETTIDFKGDDHVNKGDATSTPPFEDHLHAAATLAALTLGEAGAALVLAASQEIDAAIIADNPSLIVHMGDQLQSLDPTSDWGADEVAALANMHIAYEVLRNVSGRTARPEVFLEGNHPGSHTATAIGSSTLGALLRTAIPIYLPNPTPTTTGYFATTVPHGNVDLFLGDGLFNEATGNSTLTQLVNWAAASTATYKLFCSHQYNGFLGPAVTMTGTMAAFHAVCKALGIIVVTGHTHVAGHWLQDGVHYFQVPGVPWHNDIDVAAGATYLLNPSCRFAQNLWGRWKFVFGTTSFTATLYRNGTYVYTEPSGPYVDTIGLNEVAYTVTATTPVGTLEGGGGRRQHGLELLGAPI